VPRTPSDVPSFRLHKSTRQWFSVIAGRFRYWGPHDDPTSRRRYDRFIIEWLTGDRQSPPDPKRVTIAELVAAFMRHAATYYRLDDGTVTNELANFTKAVISPGMIPDPVTRQASDPRTKPRTTISLAQKHGLRRPGRGESARDADFTFH